MFHQLCNNVDRLHECTNSVELEQVGMVDLLHHLGLCDKVLHLHSACSVWKILDLVLRIHINYWEIVKILIIKQLVLQINAIKIASSADVNDAAVSAWAYLV